VSIEFRLDKKAIDSIQRFHYGCAFSRAVLNHLAELVKIVIQKAICLVPIFLLLRKRQMPKKQGAGWEPN